MYKKDKQYESKDKMVSHPQHYQSSNGVECINAIEAATEKLTGIEAVDTANIIKYAWRWKNKNGIQDLDKVIWYATHLKNHLEENKEKEDNEHIKEDNSILTFKSLPPLINTNSSITLLSFDLTSDMANSIKRDMDAQELMDKIALNELKERYGAENVYEASENQFLLNIIFSVWKSIYPIKNDLSVEDILYYAETNNELNIYTKDHKHHIYKKGGRN